jgi:hypothetical protein
MLPEAVAVVLAPSENPNCGIFNLTVPHGYNTSNNIYKYI